MKIVIFLNLLINLMICQYKYIPQLLLAIYEYHQMQAMSFIFYFWCKKMHVITKLFLFLLYLLF